MAMGAGGVSVGGRTGWLGRSLLVGCGLPRIRGRGCERCGNDDRRFVPGGPARLVVPGAPGRG